MLFGAIKTCAIGVAVSLTSIANAQSAPPIPSEDRVPIALLVDVTSGQILHSRRPDTRFVPASVTKVMTLYHAFELIEEGMLDPRQTFTMSDETWEDWNGEGSTMWIEPGNPVLVDDLLTGIANISANDASIVLAKNQAGSVEAWVQGMNDRARALSMASSHFGTPNGWPDEGYTFTTANDLVVLAQALLSHPQKYARYVGKRNFAHNGVEQFNYDPLIGRTEGADGIKTGYTNEAGFCYLGTASRNGQRLVLVIAAGYSLGDRARAARAYIEWGYDAFDRQSLYSEGDIVGIARVQGGDARSVELQADRAIFVNIPSGRTADLTMTIEYDGPIRAPFAAGEEIATLVVNVPDMEPARIPLVAAETVDGAGFFNRIVNGIAGWFS